jgi:hypothetical protein
VGLGEWICRWYGDLGLQPQYRITPHGDRNGLFAGT